MALQQTKVTEEELNEIEQFQKNINQLTFQLGQIALRRMDLDQQEEFLETKHLELLQEEKQLGDKLKDKYGNAQIDLKTGNITNVD
jgi:BMFP domain-containing protein YqiC